MKGLDLEGKVPTKSPPKGSETEKEKPSTDKRVKTEKTTRERRVMPRKSKAPEPRSFRFTARDEERFEAFRKLLEDEGVGDQSLSNAKVIRALLLLSQKAPKSLIRKIAEDLV